MLGVDGLHCCRYSELKNTVVSLHRVPMSSTRSLWGSSAKIEITDVGWMGLCTSNTSRPSLHSFAEGGEWDRPDLATWLIPAPVNRICSATVYC
jgi:hypothetical protein